MVMQLQHSLAMSGFVGSLAWYASNAVCNTYTGIIVMATDVLGVYTQLTQLTHRRFVGEALHVHVVVQISSVVIPEHGTRCIIIVSLGSEDAACAIWSTQTPAYSRASA